MSLIRLRDIDLTIGNQIVLDRVALNVEQGERIALVGRNGAGKTTLLRIIEGALAADSGERVADPSVRIARLEQEVPRSAAGRNVFDVVADGLGEIGTLIQRHHDLSHALASGDETALAKLDRVHHALEAAGGWLLNQRVEATLSRLKLDPDTPFDSLSGGQRRRTLLARALVIEPDVLLLDEPTNHLDLTTIEWLEQELLKFNGTVIFVTHDRVFLQHLATRIVEIDRGWLTDWPGDYANYLRRREERLAAKQAEQARFDKKLAAEEVWIRQGIKARRTRNEGRVRALERMRQERGQRRNLVGNARLHIAEAERSGRSVIEAEGISFRYDGTTLFSNFSTTILRGDKIGIIGPNGCGKSTLLRVLLGDLQPTGGTVKHGTRLEIAYFDQFRAQLEEERSVIDNVAHGSERITLGGQSRHIISYLQDFLFTPERARSAVRSLSGGERNRVLLARLFTQPANVLVLDEPTNDLDVETLELLEERLTEFGGTVLLVSHDRALLDNVVTSTMVFEGDGELREYVGGYEDWLRQRKAQATGSTRTANSAPVVKSATAAARKLSYKEQRQLDQLPGRIESLETEQASLHQQLGDPALYREQSANVTLLQQRLSVIEEELALAYQQWEALESKQ
ncbi:MAG: ATP-binding cassette domain-containing protein [Proteobacteria bacterium]|nr:MAG: ATP-binding cassette domain-containing protein [Pseudomonadota bacterium]QKK11619.1 MAG: ATP-binding cassette domain-containing protein [Pseudomonadota bacterium]